MISHIKDGLGVMIIVATVIALGMFASFTGPLVAGLVAFSGSAAADSDSYEKTERHTVRVKVVDSRTGESVPQYSMSINGSLFDYEDQYTGSEEEGVLYLHLTDGEYTLRAVSHPEYMHTGLRG